MNIPPSRSQARKAMAPAQQGPVWDHAGSWGAFAEQTNAYSGVQSY